MSENFYLGDLEKYVLSAVLNSGNDSYGVQIKKKLNDALGKDQSVSAIYTTLERLERKGYLKSRIGEATPERGGKAKMYFQVTGRGQKALLSSRESLIKVGFFAFPGGINGELR